MELWEERPEICRRVATILSKWPGCIMLFNHNGLLNTEPRGEGMSPVILNVLYLDLGYGLPSSSEDESGAFAG
jgi:hypothetical protein